MTGNPSVLPSQAFLLSQSPRLLIPTFNGALWRDMCPGRASADGKCVVILRHYDFPRRDLVLGRHLGRRCGQWPVYSTAPLPILQVTFSVERDRHLDVGGWWQWLFPWWWGKGALVSIGHPNLMMWGRLWKPGKAVPIMGKSGQPDLLLQCSLPTPHTLPDEQWPSHPNMPARLVVGELIQALSSNSYINAVGN